MSDIMAFSEEYKKQLARDAAETKGRVREGRDVKRVEDKHKHGVAGTAVPESSGEAVVATGDMARRRNGGEHVVIGAKKGRGAVIDWVRKAAEATGVTERQAYRWRAGAKPHPSAEKLLRRAGLL